MTGPSAPPRPARVFVYGTLMPGGMRWPHLAPTATAWWPSRVRGRLYDTGQGWPAAVFDGEAGSWIPGVVVELDPAQAAATLEALDVIEDVADQLYRRELVVTHDGTQAWAWPFGGSIDGMTAIDRWHRDRGER